jgi:pimeloyl-ACP methyl ester carboxylesterase
MRFPLIVFITLSLLLSSAGADDYNYPYHDPYLATATTAILNDDDPSSPVKSQVVHVPGLPNRNQLPSLEGRGQVSVALYRQNRSAPLLFLLSGIGSNSYFGVATYLARLFYQAGFHVVILPSPMNWNFALSASRTAAPGFAPADARDLYDVMQKTLPVLKSRYNVTITGINFLGVSLGGLEGAYLSVLDGEERKLGIEKYLLINPPVNLSYALKKLDEWHALGAKFGRERAQGLVAKAIGIVESFSRDSRDDPRVYNEVAKKFAAFTTAEIQFLIAEEVQSLLPELVYVTRVINDPDVRRTAKDHMRQYLESAKDLTFLDYNERLAVSLWRIQFADPEADLDTFIERGSLTRILDQLRSNSKVVVMHNADDVFTDRQSIAELKAALGDQLILYPSGGHLGNLWYPENKQRIIGVFKTAR